MLYGFNCGSDKVGYGHIKVQDLEHGDNSNTGSGNLTYRKVVAVLSAPSLQKKAKTREIRAQTHRKPVGN